MLPGFERPAEPLPRSPTMGRKQCRDPFSDLSASRRNAARDGGGCSDPPRGMLERRGGLEHPTPSRAALVGSIRGETGGSPTPRNFFPS